MQLSWPRHWAGMAGQQLSNEVNILEHGTVSGGETFASAMAKCNPPPHFFPMCVLLRQMPFQLPSKYKFASDIYNSVIAITEYIN